MGLDWKGTLEGLKDRLKEVKDKMLGDEEVQQPEKLEGNLQVIHDVVTDLWDAFADGFDLQDLGAVGLAVAKIVEVIDDVEDMEKDEKHAFVRDAALAIYRIWDPNIPIVFGSLERKLEREAVHKGVDLLIKVTLPLIRRAKKAEAVDTPQPDEAEGQPEATTDGDPSRGETTKPK